MKRFTVIPFVMIEGKMEIFPREEFMMNETNKKIEHILPTIIKKITPELKLPYVYYSIEKEILAIGDTIEIFDSIIPPIPQKIIDELSKKHKKKFKKFDGQLYIVLTAQDPFTKGNSLDMVYKINWEK